MQRLSKMPPRSIPAAAWVRRASRDARCSGGQEGRGMGRAIFRDFDEFADSITGVAGRFIPTARARAPWWMTGTQLNALSLQQFQIGGPATFAGGGETGRYTIGVPTSDVRNVRIDGRQMERNGYLLLTRARHSFAFAGLDVVRWTTVSL